MPIIKLKSGRGFIVVCDWCGATASEGETICKYRTEKAMKDTFADTLWSISSKEVVCAGCRVDGFI